MPLIDNVINIPEFLWEFAGGGSESKWNQLVDWINSGGFATDSDRDGRSFPAGSLSSTAALSTANGFPRLIFPDAASTSVFVNWGCPQWWTNFRVGYDIINESGVNGNLRLQYVLRGCPAGTAVAAATVFYNQTVTVAAPGPGVHTTFLIADNIPVTHAQFGTLWSLEITRLGADGADTLAGSVGIEEVVIARTPAT